MKAKLIFKIYEDVDFKTEIHAISLQINPEDYKEDVSIEYEKDGTTDPQYKKHTHENLSFQFVIDGTGVIYSEENVVVADKVKELDTYLCGLFTKDDKAEPYFIEVRWGKLFFQGRMKKMTVHYTLFKPNGEPLRAKVALEFIKATPGGTVSKSTTNKLEKEKRVKVKSGETLPYLCLRECGDSTLDTAIARKNGLTSIRDIKPGQSLSFDL